jgi:hypothetical protein
MGLSAVRTRLEVMKLVLTMKLLGFAIMERSQLARRPLPRVTAGNREVAGGEESPNSEGQCAG